MDPAFIIIALVTLAGGVAAMSLRNLVHCALCLIVSFAGLAAFYLHLHAQFIGFAQILIYIGAIAMLIVFAILLTRGGESSSSPARPRGSVWIGSGIALLVFACLAAAILSSAVMQRPAGPPPAAGVQPIGSKLLDEYVLPLEAAGLLLTAALIGAVIIALPEKENK